jgi:hypothetical protein
VTDNLISKYGLRFPWRQVIFKVTSLLSRPATEPTVFESRVSTIARYERTLLSDMMSDESFRD